MALNLKADENGLPAAADLDNLFNVCVRRVFSGQDIQTIRQTCSRLSTLCSVSSQVYDPSRGVFQDFRERYAKAHGSLTGPSKEEKKKLKKEQKKAQKKAKEEKKKAKKQAKKDKKKGKKKLSKKDRKKLDKDQKKQKKEKKKAEKKAKEAKKEAKKQAKKEANKAKKEQKKKEKETGLSDEAKKAKKEQKKEKRKAEKKAKEEKKKAKKQAKKSKKEEKKNHKEESKLIVAEQKLTRAEAKLAEKIKDFVSKTDKKYANLPRTKWSPSQIEKRLNDIRGALSTRETTSVSRFAPCLLFTPENGKDALDSQCATLRRASELTLQAEECWAGYLATVQHCKTSAKKKKDVKACYKGFDVANARCGELATRGRVELQKLLRAEQV